VLSRAAEPLLGPSAADRLAEAELRGRKLAERNRLARELHDSVGHALSVVTLQAAAAGRLLDSDPAFTRSALAAIEETARGALDELDHVLGLLRDEGSRRSPLPDLRDVDHLVESARAAGAQVEISMGALGDVPPAVSREAYRIVQEALTNALKHAPAAPVRVGLATPPRSAALAITVANPLLRQRRSSKDVPVRSGGRGVPGVHERAALLGGQADIGPRADEWVVQVRLPWERR
jgi:signal transduction histidine kinase